MRRSALAFALGGALAAALQVGPLSAADGPPATYTPTLSADDVQKAEALLGFACKASPGQDVTACRGAIELIDKLRAGKAKPAEPAPAAP